MNCKQEINYKATPPSFIKRRTTHEMALSQQQQTKPFSIFKILGEAFKLLAKSFTLLLPILIVFLLSSRLQLYITSPSLAALSSKLASIASIDPKSPEYSRLVGGVLKDLKDSSPILAISLIASLVLFSIRDIATIHVFTSTYDNPGKHSTHKELLCKLARGIKRPMITSLYVTLMKLGYTLLIPAIFFTVLAQGSLALQAFCAIAVLLSPFLYLYLSTVWSVSMVISVAEDGCHGLKAISKAGKVIKGRRLQGALLVLINFAIVLVIALVRNYAVGYVNSASAMERTGIELVYEVVALATNMLAWAASVVFFWDCKKDDDGEGIKDIEGGFMYVGLPTKAYDEM